MKRHAPKPEPPQCGSCWYIAEEVKKRGRDLAGWCHDCSAFVYVSKSSWVVPDWSEDSTLGESTEHLVCPSCGQAPWCMGIFTNDICTNDCSGHGYPCGCIDHSRVGLIEACAAAGHSHDIYKCDKLDHFGNPAEEKAP
jgi:hypothetical protein